VLSCIASHHLGPALVWQDWFDAPDCHTFRRGCLLVLAALNLILGEGAERLRKRLFTQSTILNP